MATTLKPLRTFDILGLYFIYGIQVQFIGTGKRFPLLGLDRQHWSVKYHASKSYEDPEMLLPVLHGFSQLSDDLVKQLVTLACPDRFTRLFLEGGMVIKRKAAIPDDAAPGDRRDAIEVWGENTATSVFTIYSDWSVSAMIGPVVAIATDYLRSQHFAVSLEPHQFIEKSAVTPTKKKGTETC